MDGLHQEHHKAEQPDIVHASTGETEITEFGSLNEVPKKIIFETFATLLEVEILDTLDDPKNARKRAVEETARVIFKDIHPDIHSPEESIEFLDFKHKINLVLKDPELEGYVLEIQREANRKRQDVIEGYGDEQRWQGSLDSVIKSQREIHGDSFIYAVDALLEEVSRLLKKDGVPETWIKNSIQKLETELSKEFWDTVLRNAILEAREGRGNPPYTDVDIMVEEVHQALKLADAKLELAFGEQSKWLKESLIKTKEELENTNIEYALATVESEGSQETLQRYNEIMTIPNVRVAMYQFRRLTSEILKESDEVQQAWGVAISGSVKQLVIHQVDAIDLIRPKYDEVYNAQDEAKETLGIDIARYWDEKFQQEVDKILGPDKLQEHLTIGACEEFFRAKKEQIRHEIIKTLTHFEDPDPEKVWNELKQAMSRKIIPIGSPTRPAYLPTYDWSSALMNNGTQNPIKRELKQKNALPIKV